MLKIKMNIFLMTILTVLTLGSNFLLYRVSHIFLKNNEAYGIWLVILSILTWFYIMDFGISNSLRNMLTRAIELKDKKRIKKLIFTTYTVMLFPLFILITLGIICNQFINWSELLNYKGDTNELNRLMIISFFMFPIVFYLNTISYIFHSYFKSYLVNLLQFLNLFLNCIILYLFSIFEISGLIKLSTIYFSINILIYLFATILFFYKKRDLKILKFENFDKSLIKSLLYTGIGFFILDISSLLLFNSGPILITYFFNPITAIEFQLPYKLLSVYISLTTIMLTPLWTYTINLSTQNKFSEIIKVVKKMSIILSLIYLLILLCSIFVNTGVNLWIGTEFNTEWEFIFLIAIVVILSIHCRSFQTVLNSLTFLRIQVISFSISIFLSLTLMYILIEILDYNKYAFVLSLIIGLLVPAIVLPIYLLFILNRKNEEVL